MKKIVFSVILTVILFTGFSQENNRFYEVLDGRDPLNEILHADAAPFNIIVYEAATTGRKSQLIPAYADTLFTRKMTAKEIGEKGMVEEVVSYAPDPNYPDEYVDTTIMADFRARDIVLYLLMMEWEVSGTDTLKKLVAIAPLAHNASAGVLYDFEVLFWVKMEDLDKVIMREPYFSYQNRQGQKRFYHYFHEKMYVAKANDLEITWE